MKVIFGDVYIIPTPAIIRKTKRIALNIFVCRPYTVYWLIALGPIHLESVHGFTYAHFASESEALLCSKIYLVSLF